MRFVGSPPLRHFLAVSSVVGAIALASVSAATAAATSSADDAKTAATAFVQALGQRDAQRFCSLLSPDALQRTGGQAECLSSLSGGDEEDDADYATIEVLDRGYTAAKLSSTKRKGQFVTKKFGPKKLARDMEQLDSELNVKLGKSWTAAKGQLATTVILDTRSTARRLVLYAESDDGSIIRLSATPTGRPGYDEVGTGIAETSPPSGGDSAPTFTATIDSVIFDAAGAAYARGTLAISDPEEEGFTFHYGILVVLVQVNGSWYVDDFFYSTLSSGPDEGS